jgi:hypothetical protein
MLILVPFFFFFFFVFFFSFRTRSCWLYQSSSDVDVQLPRYLLGGLPIMCWKYNLLALWCWRYYLRRFIKMTHPRRCFRHSIAGLSLYPAAVKSAATGPRSVPNVSIATSFIISARILRPQNTIICVSSCQPTRPQWSSSQTVIECFIFPSPLWKSKLSHWKQNPKVQHLIPKSTSGHDREPVTVPKILRPL